MKRTISILLAISICCVTGCETSSNVDPVFKKFFVKYFGTEGEQYGADILVVEDGSIFLLGNSVSPSGQNTAFVVKSDVEGNVIWERQVGGVGETAVDIELINAGSHAGNVVIGLNVGPETSSRIRVVRLDQNGQGIDSAFVPLHKFGGFRQVLKSITPLQHVDQYILTGYADQILIKETEPINETNDITDIMAFRLDNTLTLIDTVATKGGERNGSGIKVFEMPGAASEKLVLFSYSDRPNNTNEFGYNFSFDILSSGIPVGKLVGSDDEEEILSCVVKIPLELGSGFLMAGTSRALAEAGGDLYLVRYDNDLQYPSLDVKLSLERNMECVSVANAFDGFYILSNEMSDGELSNVGLVKVSTNGSIQWSRSFGTREGNDTGAAITTLPDGRIAIVATMELQTKRKLALMVLNSDGEF